MVVVVENAFNDLLEKREKTWRDVCLRRQGRRVERITD